MIIDLDLLFRSELEVYFPLSLSGIEKLKRFVCNVIKKILIKQEKEPTISEACLKKKTQKAKFISLDDNSEFGSKANRWILIRFRKAKQYSFTNEKGDLILC